MHMALKTGLKHVCLDLQETNASKYGWSSREYGYWMAMDVVSIDQILSKMSWLVKFYICIYIYHIIRYMRINSRRHCDISDWYSDIVIVRDIWMEELHSKLMHLRISFRFPAFHCFFQACGDVNARDRNFDPVSRSQLLCQQLVSVFIANSSGFETDHTDNSV